MTDSESSTSPNASVKRKDVLGINARRHLWIKRDIIGFHANVVNLNEHELKVNVALSRLFLLLNV
jgi:hypothetical protein